MIEEISEEKRSTPTGITTTEPQESSIPTIQGKFEGLEKDFKRLEKNIDKTDNFMMWAMGITIGVFMVSGILIALDYYRNNEERYEKFIDKTEEIKANFYTKEELKTILEENERNTRIIDCLKNKEYFSIKCFK